MFPFYMFTNVFYKPLNKDSSNNEYFSDYSYHEKLKTPEARTMSTKHR